MTLLLEATVAVHTGVVSVGTWMSAAHAHQFPWSKLSIARQSVGTMMTVGLQFAAVLQDILQERTLFGHPTTTLAPSVSVAQKCCSSQVSLDRTFTPTSGGTNMFQGCVGRIANEFNVVTAEVLYCYKN